MVANFTLRVLVGAAVALALWFIILAVVGPQNLVGAGIVGVLCVAGGAATTVGLGRDSRTNGARHP